MSIKYTVPDFDSVEDDILEAVAEATEKVVKDVHRGVLKNSPVLRGHFRASWRVSKDSINPTFIRSGGTEQSPLPKPSVTRMKIGTDLPTVIISNSIPYSGLIENGSSKKAPSGVLEITLVELNLA